VRYIRNAIKSTRAEGSWRRYMHQAGGSYQGTCRLIHGTARLYRINDTCVECFPTAADLVMGQPSPAPPAAS
jgi:hypothetical protein